MKVLVYGHNGWIGKMICSMLQKKEVEYIMSKCRANNLKDVEQEIIDSEVTHVMSFIGRTHGTTDDGVRYTKDEFIKHYGKGSYEQY